MISDHDVSTDFVQKEKLLNTDGVWIDGTGFLAG